MPAAAMAANGEQTPLGIGAEATARTAQAAPGSSASSIVRTIVGLAVVIGVIYGLHWVLKQVKASKEEHHSGAGLETLATLPLGPNRSLHLVQAGTELVLVGVGEHGVTPIRTYSDDEARRLGLIGGDDAAAADDAVDSPFAGGASSLAEKAGAVLSRKKPAVALGAGAGTGTATVTGPGAIGRLVDDLRSRTVIR